jgi:multidrug efflux system membrane fusion protein
MRRTIVLSVIAAVCLSGAALYLYPQAGDRAKQLIAGASTAPSTQQPQSGDQTQTGQQSQSGRQGQGGSGRRSGAGAGPVSVTTAVATTADFPIRRHAIGFVSSPAVVEVSARMSSQITAVNVKNGQMVAAGDVLFQLDDRALKAAVDRDQATLAKDQAMQASAEADLSRAKDLAAKQAGTKQAYDQALAAEKAAAATAEADQAAIEADTVLLSYATITAPIAGRLGAVNVTLGDLVSSNAGSSTATPLVTITQMDPLEVMFNLPESDLSLLQKALAQPGSAPVTLHKDCDAEAMGRGTLNFIDSTVDTASGTVAVRASVPNPEFTLWPGQYANITLDAGVLPAQVSVPTVAIQSGQKGPFVYVVGADQTVEVRQVTVALTEGDNSAIGAGLKAGERVVVEGQTRLTNGTKVREGAGGGGTGAGGGGKPAASPVADATGDARS